MLTRLLLGVVLGVLVWAASVGSAWAGGPVSCTPPSVYNPRTGTCTIVVTDPGNPGDPGTSGGGGGGSGDAGGPVKCYLVPGKHEIPCRNGKSWWSEVTGIGCYVSLTVPQPPTSNPLWEGHTDGAIYDCYSPLIAMGGGTPMTSFWSLVPPAGPSAPPDPRVLAQRAIAQMKLRAVNIGIVPEPRPGSVGVIGLPTWMWVEGPGEQTMGPIIRLASAGGFTVTATAKVDRIVWDMGDGASVTCHGHGTPYQDSFGKSSSPTCGHTYTRQGAYTVTATSYWTVAWTGLGQSGTIPLHFSDTSNITMGEAQVLTQ